MADTSELRSIIARAFVNDPTMTWMFPNPAHRLDSVAAWLGIFVESYVDYGNVEVVDESGVPVGVSLWHSPDQELEFPALPTRMGLLAALTDDDHANSLREAFHEMSKVAPEAPSAYIYIMAVDPDHQGRGFGTALLKKILSHIEESQTPAHLETTNPANVPFYESFGFRVSGQLELASGGPTLWAMQR